MVTSGETDGIQGRLKQGGQNGNKSANQTDFDWNNGRNQVSLWKGLQIHQARTKCGSGKQQQRERTVNTDETTEDHSQEAHHRAEDLLPNEATQINIKEEEGNRNKQKPAKTPSTDSRKEKIQWPPTDDRRWEIFDEDLDKILDNTITGDVQRKISSLSTIIYAVGQERFGGSNTKTREGTQGNTKHYRRQQDIQTLRTEISDVTKQYKRANEEEKEGLNELRSILRERRNNLQRAERIRKARRESGKKRAMFVANPYKFTKATLDGTKAVSVKRTKEEVEKHLSETHSDERQWEHLGNCERIENVPEPEIPMNIRDHHGKKYQML
ncbi:Hypothetical predicted protein [Mytilus galloprovincialis]|uniref:Uncharacterized protein n=1 Tax=Mytilus galloprovincialis TaxID=29158 RepID=A0A8B6F5H8_MYTGA|nr:Hypothetical predicted protein [Mytilus galloprovincialis]